MNPTAAQYFGAMLSEYDSLIRRAVPRYDELIERLVAYLPPGRERIVELGCGTGNLTVALARAFPDAELVLVDASAEMLAATRQRLGQRPGVTLVESTFEQLALEPGACDAVTSCIAVHHVVDKAALFVSMHGWLAAGGALCLADQMGGASEGNRELNWAGMLAFWQRPGHLSADEQQSLVDHAAAHDHYTPVVELIRMAEAAGFGELDCVWRNWLWGVLTARA